MQNSRRHNKCNKKDIPHSVCPDTEKNCNTPCPEEEILSVPQCPCEDKITISGKVTYRKQGVHLAKVIVTSNRQIIAECLTDCDGCYTFQCQKGRYTLRAFKNRLRSAPRIVNCSGPNSYTINFNIM